MAQHNINLKLKLSSVIDLYNLTLPTPGASGYPLAIPTHLTATKSICSELGRGGGEQKQKPKKLC